MHPQVGTAPVMRTRKLNSGTSYLKGIRTMMMPDSCSRKEAQGLARLVQQGFLEHVSGSCA
jgi:hypothetical protein